MNPRQMVKVLELDSIQMNVEDRDFVIDESHCRENLEHEEDCVMNVDNSDSEL